MNKIGKLMKERRTALNMQAKDLAKSLSVAESTYREWENGRRIQGEPYLRIAEILEISVLELLGAEDVSKSKLLLKIDSLENQVKNIRKTIIQIF